MFVFLDTTALAMLCRSVLSSAEYHNRKETEIGTVSLKKGELVDFEAHLVGRSRNAAKPRVKRGRKSTLTADRMEKLLGCVRRGLSNKDALRKGISTHGQYWHPDQAEDSFEGLDFVFVAVDKTETRTAFVREVGRGENPIGCNSHTDTAGSLPTAYRHDIVESRNLRLVGMCEQGPGSLEAIALHESSEG